MKTNLLISAFLLLAGSVLAADTTPKDDVIAAAKKLADADNYSWTTTVTVPEDSPFHPGPTNGKIEKDGLTFVTMSFGDNTTEMVLKGDKGAVKPPDGDWESLSDLANAEGRERFLGMMARGFKAPAAQAQELGSGVKELKLADGVYSGDLTEDGAKAMLRFGPRRNGGPEISNAKGSTKFWVTDGRLSKYQFSVQGTVNFNGEDHDIQRTTTVEIKDVGTTKVTVPEGAKKKLS
jgi:hypothetical protein